MSKLSFVKYEGIGNDFILIDDREERFIFDPLYIQQLCHRKFGIGADGLILLQNGADYRMRIFNCDGKEAECCGNGLRCLVHFIRELGLARERVKIEVQGRAYDAKWVGGEPAVDMGAVKEIRLHLETEEGVVHFGDSGVPHVVQFVDDVERVDLMRVGRFLRNHRLFVPKGANVNVARKEGRGIWARTYERGVEGETLACGTGAAAIAAIARELYGKQGPFSVHFRGGTLTMDGNWMVGPVRPVFSGSV